VSIEDRFVRLEENLGFAEHTIEQLSTELASMNHRLAEVLARLQRLEARLDILNGTISDMAAPDERSTPGDSSGGELPD
jgi:uncharacterized coiled-coil protein SlyX